MPPNGPDEWRARIGHWENRKLRWYQAHCGSRPRVSLHLHLERVISEAPLLCVLLLLSLVEKVGTGVYGLGNGSLGKLAGVTADPIPPKIRSGPCQIRYASDIDPTLADWIQGINGVIGFPLSTFQSLCIHADLT